MGYSRQFKQEVLRRLVEEEVTASQLAEEIGISRRTLSRWSTAAGITLTTGQIGGTADRVDEMKRQAVVWLHAVSRNRPPLSGHLPVDRHVPATSFASTLGSPLALRTL